MILSQLYEERSGSRLSAVELRSIVLDTVLHPGVDLEHNRLVLKHSRALHHLPLITEWVYFSVPMSGLSGAV